MPHQKSSGTVYRQMMLAGWRTAVNDRRLNFEVSYSCHRTHGNVRTIIDNISGKVSLDIPGKILLEKALALKKHRTGKKHPSRKSNKSHRYEKVISRNASALLNGDDNRANRYFRLMVARACACSSGGKIRTVAGNSAPVTFPRIVDGATRTCGLLRMRLVLPMSLRVITYNRSPSSPNHTGVATPAPLLRNVTREMYFCP